MAYTKNLIIYATAGILVACLIITAIVMAPWESITSYLGFPKLPPGWPSGPLTVQVFISNLTEPHGIGNEGTVTVIVTSTRNVSDVIVQFDLLQVVGNLPIGIVYIDGNLANITWNGNLEADVSMVFNARMRIVEVGYARIWITATWHENEWLSYQATDSIWILIQESSIQISDEPITPPGFIEAQPSNGTLPIWPNGTLWEP